MCSNYTYNTHPYYILNTTHDLLHIDNQLLQNLTILLDQSNKIRDLQVLNPLYQ
jgi:hypothetical protein